MKEIEPTTNENGGEKFELRHKFLTKEHAADLLGVTTRTIDNWMRRGLLNHIKIGRLVRFRYDDIIK